MATRTDTQLPALHVADSHDLIRVQGAGENNLKDVSVEILKRQRHHHRRAPRGLRRHLTPALPAAAATRRCVSGDFSLSGARRTSRSRSGLQQRQCGVVQQPVG